MGEGVRSPIMRFLLRHLTYPTGWADADTGYYVADDVIWGPREAGKYRVRDSRIYGPGTHGEFWIGPKGRIFGPGQDGSFRIENGRVFGPHADMPWLPR